MPFAYVNVERIQREKFNKNLTRMESFDSSIKMQIIKQNGGTIVINWSPKTRL